MNNPIKKTKEEGLVPELRFPEFREEMKWKNINFYDCLTDVLDFRGRTPKKLGMDWGGGDIISLSANNVKNGYIDFDAECHLGSPELHQKWMGAVNLKKGDIIFTMEAPLGNALIVKDSRKYILSQRVVAFKTKENIINEFLIQLIWNDIFQSEINLLSTGSTAKGINQKTFKTIRVNIPINVEEQQKIAGCLSSLDDLVNAHSKKLDSLKAHKKGLMQQLFPAEGESTPKLRFPEFQEKWEECLFGEIIKVNSGKGFKASEYSSSGTRLLQIENVGYGSTKWNENTIYLPNSYKEDFPELALRKGDIVLALNRPVTNDELKIALIKKDDEPSILYQRVGKLEILNNAMDVNFTFQLCNDFVKEFVINKSIGSDQPFIALRDLYAQKIRIPLIIEQQKIADCLSSLDDLITAQSKKIAALKSHKKGLMQQLFPTVNEIST